MKKTLLLIGFLLLAAVVAPCSHAETAMETLQKAASKIRAAKGVDAAFSLTSQGKTLQGHTKAKGTKFYVELPGLATWCDGKNMWTYNSSTKETTLSLPTAEEMAESNPLAYLSMGSNFKASYGKNAPKGSKAIILTPAKRSSGITAIVVTLDAKTLLPQKIVAKQNGVATTIAIKKLNLNASLTDAAFTYPKSKYPKIPIIDLR